MAKLGAYYGLCPLIDHRSLLGISEDEENGIVIVTLGKNIAIKYKLSDQKQLHSWRTKEKFSSPIIYDKLQSKYVTVFNESYVRMWSDNEEFLDKLKKFKFNQQIYTIFRCKERSFILFNNGAVSPLKEAIENRKVLNPENVIDLQSECISEVLYTSLNKDTYVGLIIKSNDNNYLYWTKIDATGKQDKYCKIVLSREDTELRGYLFHVGKSSVNFLSLWSDGRVFSVKLKDTDLDCTNPGELFTVIEAIACKEYVSMIALDQNYIALYGCNCNEEGALLVIYNVQFKVIQSKQPFKLFTNGAKLWCIDGNLLFPVGQNLAVIPFYLDMEQLAALVGSHTDLDPDVSIVQKVQIASWGNSPKLKTTNIPEILKPKISEFLAQGLTENSIFETLLSEIVDNKNVELLSQSIHYFSDIPEKCLGNVLKLVLNFDPKLFKQNLQSIHGDFPEKLQPLERAELLDLIFVKSFNETLFLPHLRSVLTLDEVLTVLQYIYFLLSENGHNLPSLNSSESEKRLIEWSCLLLDANYQKILMTRDNKVNEVLLLLKKLIKEELSCFDDLVHVASLMNEIKMGRSIHKRIHLSSLDYSIEEFPLY